tara:strand:- start:1385 stop:2005 length:621 start_codon:yes stop_codon:yes gene_type:complete
MEFTKNLNSLAVATLACASLGSATAIQSEEYEKGIYVNLGIGSGSYSDVVWSDGATDTYEFGFGFETGIGYDFGKNFRTEITYSNLLSENDQVGKNFIFQSLVFNGFIDFPLGDSRYTPFVGLGLGYTHADAKDLCVVGTSTDCFDDVATFSLSGGLAYAINDSTELTAKATYLGFDDINMKNHGQNFTVSESDTLTFLLGARVTF